MHSEEIDPGWLLTVLGDGPSWLAAGSDWKLAGDGRFWL